MCDAIKQKANVYYKCTRLRVPHTNISHSQQHFFRLVPCIIYALKDGNVQTKIPTRFEVSSWTKAVFCFCPMLSLSNNLIKYTLHYKMGRRFIFPECKAKQEINTEEIESEAGRKKREPTGIWDIRFMVDIQFRNEWKEIKALPIGHQINPMLFNLIKFIFFISFQKLNWSNLYVFPYIARLILFLFLFYSYFPIFHYIFDQTTQHWIMQSLFAFRI